MQCGDNRQQQFILLRSMWVRERNWFSHFPVNAASRAAILVKQSIPTRMYDRGCYYTLASLAMILQMCFGKFLDSIIT